MNVAPRRALAAAAVALLTLTACEDTERASLSAEPAATSATSVSPSPAPRAFASLPPARPAATTVAPKPLVRATTAAPKPSPRPSPAPAPKPVPKPTPKPPAPKPVALSTCGAPSNPWGYNFCGRGSTISSPPDSFCDYFDCIPSFWDSTNGYVMECDDSMYSHSGGRSGSCSHHGGNNRALYG
jgi:hypothetical protein